MLLRSSRRLPSALRRCYSSPTNSFAASQSDWVDPARLTTRSSQHANDRQLWVSYTDPAILRRRLIGLAQQVCEQCVEPLIDEAVLPSLIVPKNPETQRKGFWFMRFEELAHADQVQKELLDKPFTSYCGSMEGKLHVAAGIKPGDLRFMLDSPVLDPDPVVEWLRARFSVHGDIESIQRPPSKCNWDGGLAFITFATADDAEEALEALDGTPSLTPGCNMFIDYALVKQRPLYEIRPHPDADPYDTPAIPKKMTYEGAV